MCSPLTRIPVVACLLALASFLPASADPAPLDRLAWLAGSWSCATPAGTPLSYKQVYAQTSRGITQNYTLLGSPLSGLIAYDGKQFVYTSTTQVRKATITQRMTAPLERVTPDSFEFSGTVAAGGKTEKERWEGKQTGINTYADRAYAYVNGAWQQILEVDCKRI